MDEDGQWFWYEKEPEPAHNERVFRNADVDDTSRFESAKVKNICWYQSLEKRP
jgi:hypothetical protein